MDFPIQNLPPDLQLQVRYRHLGCFWVGSLALRSFRQKWPAGLVNVVNGSVGTVTSRHHTGHRAGPIL